MASTDGAMICCIRSVASIPPDLRRADRACETPFRENHRPKKQKSGPVAHPDANRHDPFWRDHRIVWDHGREYSQFTARRKDFPQSSRAAAVGKRGGTLPVADPG